MTTALTAAEPTAEIQWRRLSPRMLLVHPVTEVGKALPAVAGAFVAGGSSGHGSLWGLGATAVVTCLAILRWFTTRFRITAGQVQLQHGLLRRKTIVTPLDRVRTVDVTAHLLHRMLGLAKVVIGTGTSDRKGRGRLELNGLNAAAAGRLREELLHRGRPAGPVDAGPAQPPVEHEIVRLNPAWVRYAPFTLSGAITGLALLGFAWRLNNEANLKLNRSGPLRAVGNDLRHTSIVLDAAAIAISVIAFVAVASTVGYVLAFWNFRLTRHSGGTLHVTRGLITSRATSIERRRLHGAEVSEALLLRSVGGARCLAIATGLRVRRGAERGGELLLPPAPRAQVIRVAGEVIDTAAPFTLALRPHGAPARRRRLIRAFAGTVVLIALLDVVLGLTGAPRLAWLAPLALLVVAAPLGLDRYRSLGHALSDGYVVASYGSLVRRRSVIACEGVIGWNFKSTFFQRRLGLTTLTATSAAGKQKYRIYDIATAEAVAFAEQAVAGLVSQFAQR